MSDIFLNLFNTDYMKQNLGLVYADPKGAEKYSSEINFYQNVVPNGTKENRVSSDKINVSGVRNYINA